MSYVAIATATASVVGGAANTIALGKTNKKIDSAMSKRKAFQTPDEVFKILNATENKSQGDTITRDYQTNAIDRAFANAMGNAEILGGDPNSLSSMFEKKVQGILDIGDKYHASNMESFGNYMKALNVVADNKAAEQISQDNIWKDYMQSLSKQKSDQQQSINNSINSLIGSASSFATGNLYKDNNKTQSAQGAASGAVGSGGGVG